MSASLMVTRLIFLLVLLASAVPGFSQSAPAGAEAHVGRGYEALKLDRYDEAVKEFRAALAIDPELVERAQFPLAVALFELHKPDDAHREFETIRSRVGDHPNVLYYLGRTDIEVRNFAAAVSELSIAAAQPPFPDTYYYLGFAYFKQNDLPAAEKWLKKSAEATPGDARVPYQLGLVYQKMGRAEDARKWLATSEEIRQRDDRNSQLKTDCARKLDEGKREEAHQLCDQLYDENNAERLMTLGTIYAQHGDPQAALKPLQRAAELAPQSPQMQYNLALAYFQMNEYEKARVPLETALKRWPDLFQLSFLYGAVLLNLNENEAAYSALRHARELNPQDSTTAEMLFSDLLALAQKSANAGRYDDAVTRLEEAAKLSPQDPKPHHFLSEVYDRVGNSKQAAVERQKADELTSTK